MGDKFIYSNPIGTFLFDESGAITDKMLFHDVVASNRKLLANEWLDEEKALIKKVNSKILFLGFKREKIENVVFTNDPRKLENTAIRLADYEPKIREAFMKLVKAEIKDSVQEDELISQAIGAVQEIDKATGALIKSLREWHGLKNPELSADVSDNEVFVKKVLETTERSEMGAKLSEQDELEIKELARNILTLLKLRNDHEKYIEGLMRGKCPNLMAIAGAPIGAKLIAAAGSLRKLAIMPASTLQLLGAERSMFNFLKRKAKRMPRFGILHEHKLVSSSGDRGKGKAARLLADKISIAARVDFFKGEFIADKLLKDVEARLK